MKGFLNGFMKLNQNADEIKLSHFENQFNHSIKASHAVFGDKAFRKIDSQTAIAETLVNRAIFDIMMVGFSHHQLDKILANKSAIYQLFVNLLASDSIFTASLGHFYKFRSLCYEPLV
jgi:hypothetical protein